MSTTLDITQNTTLELSNDEGYTRDSGYAGRESTTKMSISTTRNNGSIDLCLKEHIQYDSGKFRTNMQFHNYKRVDIEALRDFLTAQLDNRKYW